MIKRITGILLIIFALLAVTGGDLYSQGNRFKIRGIEKSVAGKKRKKQKEAKVREPRAVTKAKRTQEKKEAKREKEYQKSVEAGKKRHYEIQGDGVQERMKQNEKETTLRDRERKKRMRQEARKSGASRKYKRR